MSVELKEGKLVNPSQKLKGYLEKVKNETERKKAK